MTEGGIAVGLSRAFKQKARAGWLSVSEVITLLSAMTEGGIAVGLNRSLKQNLERDG